ncbi:MAG: hypothetical protein KHX26_09740, partial [Burkholderiales bacterium]|nr:hypothetical protein [Burkholderiales bacterium]
NSQFRPGISSQNRLGNYSQNPVGSYSQFPFCLTGLQLNFFRFFELFILKIFVFAMKINKFEKINLLISIR